MMANSWISTSRSLAQMSNRRVQAGLLRSVSSLAGRFQTPISSTSVAPFVSLSSAPSSSLLSSSSSTSFRSFGSEVTPTTPTTPPPFEKILIANRGEIACRVIRTCKKLGIKTVAIYSEPDALSLHVRLADEAVCVGPAASSQSYLVIDNIIEACKQTGAQAVHPGYGFLSENSVFCDELQKHNIVFIGPKVPAIEAMGDKIASKKLARDANVNTIPGFLGVVKTNEEVIKIAQEIGYPVMIKASAGGGGKGMRIARTDEEAVEGFRLSTQEAISSFGDERIFLEKFIEDPRHIEIQVLCDSQGNGIYLNERECSIQRRNQKVVEEAPSPFIDPETRKLMGEQAVSLAKACNYESAGTVEFLVDKNKNFFFLEMNTRLQVEHPITEFITGVDLVENMLNIAAGRELTLKQEDVQLNGWAMESRVYAENPYMDFLPSIGWLEKYIEPEGEGVRCDSGVTEGSEISIHYDPLICKLVTYGKDRNDALVKMRTALDEYVIRGVINNTPFLRDVYDHPKFISGDITTKFIEEEYPDGFKGIQMTHKDKEAVLAGALFVHCERVNTSLSIEGQLGSFNAENEVTHRLGSLVVEIGEGEERETFLVHLRSYFQEDDNEVAFDYAKMKEDGTVDIEGEVNIRGTYENGDLVFNVSCNDEIHSLQVMKANDESPYYNLQYKGTSIQTKVYSDKQYEMFRHMPIKEVVDTSKQILSPMPGAIFSVNVAVGDVVSSGQEVCVVEAMKMQNVLRSSTQGVVKSINVVPGQIVASAAVLIDFE